MYVLTDGAHVVHALTDSPDIVRWWRKRDPHNVAIKRELISTREDWIRVFNPSFYDQWIRAGENK